MNNNELMVKVEKALFNNYMMVAECESVQKRTQAMLLDALKKQEAINKKHSRLITIAVASIFTMSVKMVKTFNAQDREIKALKKEIAELKGE